MEDVERLVVLKLISDGVIPSSDIFQITEYHLTKYIETYGSFFSKTNKGVKTKSNYRFARKLAGLTLLKVNFDRNAKFSVMKSGLIYMIENPQFPDHYKLGMTIELKSRLDSYQTYDPYRKFSVVKYDFVLDRALIERKLLNHPDILRECGEWVKKENAVSIFESVVFNPG